MQNSGNLLPAGLIGSSTSKSDSAGRPRVRRLVSASTVGASNRLRMLISASMLERIRLINRIASSECPPSSKKLSSMPTRSTPSTSANNPQRISSCGVRGARRACVGAESGLGQRAAVELAVRRQRQLVESDDRRRHHVVRQAGAEVLAQRRRRNALSDRHHIGDEPLVPRHVLARDHHRLRHAALPQQRRLDLARLDPESAQLHLLVRPAQELQHAVRAPPRQVAGPVHPARRPAPCGSATNRSAVSPARCR